MQTRVYSVAKGASAPTLTFLLDHLLINSLQCDSVKIDVLDSTGCDDIYLELYSTGSGTKEHGYPSITVPLTGSEVNSAYVTLNNGTQATDAAVVKVQYLKNGVCVGDNVLSDGGTTVLLLTYKVEMPANAKVTLFDGDDEVQFLSWNIPCPLSFPNMTFLQVKAANGFEQQLTPSAGSQTIELYQELGRRYAVFGEIWSYSSALTLWFADLQIQLSDYNWKICVPTAGEGGTIVTALPQ